MSEGEGLFNLSEYSGAQEKAEDNLENQKRQAEDAQLQVGEQPPASWYWADNQPGDGDKPEWLNGKFKTAEQQAKAYTELEKKFGAFVGAPESYDFSSTLGQYEGLDYDADSDTFKSLAGLFKENNVNQKFADELMDLWAKDQVAQRVTQEDVLEQLGEQGERMVRTIANYGSQNLTSDELDTLQGMMNTSEQVGLLHKVFVNLWGDPNIANPQAVNDYMPRQRTMDDVRREIMQLKKEGKYDRTAAEKLMQELTSIKSDRPYVQDIGGT